MQVVYVDEEAPNPITKSIFLVGPTPRSPEVPSWRPGMLRYLEALRYDGVVFVPELRNSVRSCGYDGQIVWERKHLDMCDCILAWVPRDLETMPAFTTNVEFGNYIHSGKIVYGRPDDAPKNGYLDWLYKDQMGREPYNTMADLAKGCIDYIGKGVERHGDERFFAMELWRNARIRFWYGKEVSDNCLTRISQVTCFKEQAILAGDDRHSFRATMLHPLLGEIDVYYP